MSRVSGSFKAVRRYGGTRRRDGAQTPRRRTDAATENGRRDGAQTPRWRTDAAMARRRQGADAARIHRGGASCMIVRMQIATQRPSSSLRWRAIFANTTAYEGGY